MAAPTIDATVSGPDANCYLTLAEANTYFTAHVYSDVWDNADDDTKTRALLMAARLIDEHAVFFGFAATLTQRLQWPRFGLHTVTGYWLAPTIVPDRIKAATAEFAQFLLVSNRTTDTGAERKGLKSLKAGPVTFDYDLTRTSGEKVLPDEVIAQLRPWLKSIASRPVSVPLVRG